MDILMKCKPFLLKMVQIYTRKFLMYLKTTHLPLDTVDVVRRQRSADFKA